MKKCENDLTEILMKSFDKHNVEINKQVAVSVVEELLDNKNIAILPCSIGDEIFIIKTYGGNPYRGVTSDFVQMIGITSRGIHIKCRKNHDHNKTYFLGKTAFLDKASAQAALENWK